MALANSFIVLSILIATSLCLPLKREKDGNTNLDIDETVPQNVKGFEVLVPKTMSEKDRHIIVRRSERAGIISGSMCPENEWRMPSGECIPCRGQHHPGCPPSEDDYYEDTEID